MKTKTGKVIIGALSAAAWLLSGAVTLKAQDGPPAGNVDPEQRRQRMMERMREQFGVTDDTEWKAISERIGKVMEARRSMGGGFGGGFMRGPGGPGGPGGAGGPPPRAGNDQGNADNAGAPPPQGGAGGFGGGPGGPGGPGPGFGRPSSPETEALRKAVESKASADELKARMAEVKAARQKNQAVLEKAQLELKEVLSVRQEAVAMTLGLVN